MADMHRRLVPSSQPTPLSDRRGVLHIPSRLAKQIEELGNGSPDLSVPSKGGSTP